MRVKDFKVEIGTNFKDDKRDITITGREYKIRTRKSKNKIINVTDKIYKYTCNRCIWTEGYIEEYTLLKKGSGCPVCCKPSKIVVEGINDIPTTAPWMVKYFQGGYDEAKLYTCQSSKKIRPICPDCGKVKTKSISISNIYKNKSIGCICSDNISMPNKILHILLAQFNKYYNFNLLEFEYSPSWISPKKYDAYFELDNKKYIVEMDGGLGHGYGVHGSSNKSNQDMIDLDRFKETKAYEHDIIIIRIDCDYRNIVEKFEYIKNNILLSDLKNIFNMNVIDWYKIEQYTLTNQIKEVCIFYNNNKNMTTAEIGKVFLLHRKTIAKYLSFGNKFNWCNYTKKDIEKRRLKAISEHTKKVICISTNEIFNSTKVASDYYNINYNSLKSCCLGINKTSGKKKWRYFDELNDNISSFLLPKVN